MIITYSEKYYLDLAKGYEENFGRKLLPQELYDRRFSWMGEPTSYLYTDSKQVLGHIGYRLRMSESGVVAFRFSTFISKTLRGKGCYQELRSLSMQKLRELYDVQIVYTWPNRINLLSSLKDPEFRYERGIPTWECRGKLQIIGDEIDIADITLTDEILEDINKNSLTIETSETFLSELQVRKDRVFKVIVSDGRVQAILSKKVIDGIEYIAYYFARSEYILNASIDNSMNVINQLWISGDDRELMRSALKKNFEQRGPVFNLGTYDYRQNKSSLLGNAKMYHHDAF